jgi:hypothetical protein
MSSSVSPFALRQRTRSMRFSTARNASDHLHPDNAGYAATADAIYTRRLPPPDNPHIPSTLALRDLQ